MLDDFQKVNLFLISSGNPTHVEIEPRKAGKNSSIMALLQSTEEADKSKRNVCVSTVVISLLTCLPHRVM